MSKYYVNCGSVQKIVSLEGSALDVAVLVLNDMNDHDVLDEYVYVDQRGMRDYKTADPMTQVVKTMKVLDILSDTLEEDIEDDLM